MQTSINDFLFQLQQEKIITDVAIDSFLSKWRLCFIDCAFWEKMAIIAVAKRLRFVGLWAQDKREYLECNCVFEGQGEYVFMRTCVIAVDARLISLSPHFPAASRLERHAHDLFGIEFIGGRDTRRWTRHQAWVENEFPLQKEYTFINNERNTPSDSSYVFDKVEGVGVYEIPVGPIHAGIIEPGHFRFQAAGEDVINLEERLGYVHKGIEKLAEGLNPEELLKLASRISGDSAVAYSWATCQACESALNINISARASFLRAILLERERVANHLGDIGAICNDVGYGFAYYQLMRLRELWLRINHQVFGHRLLMDQFKVGGVINDITPESCSLQLKQIELFRGELKELYRIFEANSGLHDRLKTTGILTHENAMLLNVIGYAGRASGVAFDVRVDASYAPYDQVKVNVPVLTGGDVLARARIRAQEIATSFDYLEDVHDAVVDLIEYIGHPIPLKNIKFV